MLSFRGPRSLPSAVNQAEVKDMVLLLAEFDLWLLFRQNILLNSSRFRTVFQIFQETMTGSNCDFYSIGDWRSFFPWIRIMRNGIHQLITSVHGKILIETGMSRWKRFSFGGPTVIRCIEKTTKLFKLKLFINIISKYDY